VLTLGCADDTTPKDAVFVITPSTGDFTIDLTASGAGTCANLSTYSPDGATYSSGVMTMLGNNLAGTWG